MLDKLTVYYLKPLHGAFNTGVFILLLLQALLGLKMQVYRRAAAPPPLETVKKHRSLGPVISLCSAAGFCGGAALAYLDHGHILPYPLHFSIGLTTICLLVVTTLVSRHIRVNTDSLRNLHFGLGLVVIVLFALQIFLGLKMVLKT